MNDPLIDPAMDESVDAILCRGLVKPPGMRRRIAEMTRHLGVTFVMWDTSFSLGFTLLTVALAFGLLLIIPERGRYTAAFAVAPLQYLALLTFVETAERSSGLYELKQSCRYTIRQITALRALWFSALGAAGCAVCAWIASYGLREFLRLLCLCLASMFICAAAAAVVSSRSRARWVDAAFAAAWMFVMCGLPLIFGKTWESILSRIPVLLSLAAAAAGMVILIIQLRAMLLEVNVYALR